MFPKLDPKKMQAIMSQMGIKQEEIDAKRVVIETEDKNIVINNPSIIKINMKGENSFQISGDVEEDGNEDIKTIMEKTNCSEEQAKQALEDSKGDLADAILSLS